MDRGRESSCTGSSSSFETVDKSLLLTRKFVEAHTSKKDLLERLRRILKLLREDECDVGDNQSSFPGLASLCQGLTGLLEHQDKLVRLYTVSTCMELFAVYAPSAPWGTDETLEIFRQTIRQLANLSHTTLPSQSNFIEYYRILELLASVRIGIVLVELTKEDGKFSHDALQVLCELFRTLLQSVRLEHPPEIPDFIQATIGVCLEEYNEGTFLPIPLLDELLLCVGQGPTVLVTNPQKAKNQRTRKNLPIHQVEQANPSYLVASSIIRKTVDRLSTPISALLNGLLNKDQRTVSESSILTELQKEIAAPQPQNQLLSADIWSIIYELHKVAPSILTTVIGNLSNFLTDVQLARRLLVVRLLGRMFVKSNKMALQFRQCFRSWLRRTNDVDIQIRLAMVGYHLQLIHNIELSNESKPMLKQALNDNTLEVRLEVIHGLCDIAYRNRDIIAQDLWSGICSRLSSKNKEERKDTLTGLAQTYHKQYIEYHLSLVQNAGDDCPLDLIAAALQNAQKDCGRYDWIPSKIFECACWVEDSDLQLRILKLMDDKLLGSNLQNTDANFTATAKAVGLAIVIDQLQPNGKLWMGHLCEQRSKMQSALSKYLEARSQIKHKIAGSEEALTANANALDLLEVLSSYTPLQITPGERHPILEKFHALKDEKIFRILASISIPTISAPSRIRALGELSRAVKDIGDAIRSWLKGIVRRCAMGTFLNEDVIHHSILLAQESFMKNNVELCNKFLSSVEFATESFPTLAASKESFSNLIELFSECVVIKEPRHIATITTMTKILSRVAPNTLHISVIDLSCQKQLIDLCSKDGTPEQAQYAASTLISLNEHGTIEGLTALLQTLASRLTRKNKRIVSILAALTKISEMSPKLLLSSNGIKMVEFALDKILISSKNKANEHHQDDTRSSQKDSRIALLPSSRRSHSKKEKGHERKNRGVEVRENILQNQNLSSTCRTLCAAMDFLAAFIRSSQLLQLTPHFDMPSDDFILSSIQEKFLKNLSGRFFNVLTETLSSKGIPPSIQGRQECTLHQERAALRQFSAVNILRLCDARLALESKYLTPERWHILGATLLDDEPSVRHAVMNEVESMLTGNGAYGASRWNNQAMAPRLRFLALVTLCVNVDVGLLHSRTKGTVVGKKSSSIKANATQCVIHLRKAYEVAAAQSRASGKSEEEQFQRSSKFLLMPEYALPYAFHILAYRPETPQSALDGSMRSSVPNLLQKETENQHKILRKRLKWLFDPLVLSMGNSADNISFLLRMTEIVGTSFQPIKTRDDSQVFSENESQRRLKVVCSAAREVLLSYIKKDINLSTYPGVIELPRSLFRRRMKSKFGGRIPKSLINDTPSEIITTDFVSQNVSGDEPDDLEVRSPLSAGILNERDRAKEQKKKGISEIQEGKISNLSPTQSSPQASKLKFSELKLTTETNNLHEPSPIRTRARASKSFEDLSPIGMSPSPGDPGKVPLLSSGEKTQGSLTPNAFRQPNFSLSPTENPDSMSNRKKDRKEKIVRSRTFSEAEDIGAKSKLNSHQGVAGKELELPVKRKLQVLDKFDQNREEKSHIKRIRVVRHKPLKHLLRRRHTRSATGQSRIENISLDDSLEFDGRTTEVKEKENLKNRRSKKKKARR